jgi:hypothetical protein
MEKAASLPMRCKAIQREAPTSSRLPTIPASQNMFLNIFFAPKSGAHLTIKRNRKTSGNINVKAREACDETQPSKIVSAAAERTPLCGAGARLAIATG